jgi:phosphopantetheinyl transferase
MGWEQVEVLVEKFEGQGVTVSALPSALSRSERERAGRFRFARDRERYVWRQTRLRMVLAERLGCGAEEVEYAFSEQGKPGLGGRFAGAGLWFSLSHSDGLMAIALSERGEVGVDWRHWRAGVCRRVSGVGFRLWKRGTGTRYFWICGLARRPS